MKTYLPHYFKRIGILFVSIAFILSCISGVDDFRKGFMKGYTEQQGLDEESAKVDQSITPYFTKEESDMYANISLFFSITGFFLYLFSKEKIDDEFMQHLRLKSMLQAFIVSWIIYGTAKVFSSIIPMDGIYILQMQLIVYVILFQRNKNKELSEEEEIALRN
ncbi:hypothetical protein DWB61_08490 [Ancylomarina euxinus]|uniref:Uncharacterized protein n=1 Tax=Ancylomarina euxinus TaxID=2283627 RepID=A0A425Y1F6_9BACT|nr:hypothetical protein [Ancylomarina euxinus]MCZ4695177.1 hypothetical protein [Ancylomarina euxinus]MUP14889.1 hypothetical protein [Ancylomarina euxinus]RRG21784.1 hypothetical protein DWB61_08490 [Ancylomarina euxinus]